MALGRIGIIAAHVQCERVFCFLDGSDCEKRILSVSGGRNCLKIKVKNGHKIHVPDSHELFLMREMGREGVITERQRLWFYRTEVNEKITKPRTFSLGNDEEQTPANVILLGRIQYISNATDSIMSHGFSSKITGSGSSPCNNARN